jgi:hypothetical protein
MTRLFAEGWMNGTIISGSRAEIEPGEHFRNLTDEQKAYLRGKRYQAERKLEGAPLGNKYASKQPVQKEQVVSVGGTAERLAEEYGVSPITIRRNAR